MEKLFNRISKKMTAVILSIAMLIPTFSPLTVLATNYGEGDYNMSISVEDDELTDGSFDSITVNGDAWASDADSFKTVNGEYTIVLTLTADDEEHTVNFRRGGFEAATVTGPVINGNQYTYTITSQATQMNPHFHFALFSEEANGGEPEHNFDGSAYFTWKCGNNICYHKVNDLTGRNPQGGYDMNYVGVNTLADESGNNVNYTWNQEKANWVLSAALEDEHGDLIPERLNEEYIFGDGTEENRGVQLDPAGAKNGANSICTNGNMEFRACITRDGYQAVQFNSNSDNYTYFPKFWDQTFFTSTIDVSGTTAANPAEYDVYLLETTVSFTTAPNSSKTITSVKALDVNPNAVSITKVDNEFRVKFNSNYYDKVVFELTDASGEKQYIRIARVSIQAYDNFAPNVDGKVIAVLFYPTTNSYNDYEVVANIISKDGSRTTKVVGASKVDTTDTRFAGDEFDKINDYVYRGGKGLNLSQYDVDVDKNTTAGIYFTVVKKGALADNTYGGTFSGSDNGTYYSMSARKVVYE